MQKFGDTFTALQICTGMYCTVLQTCTGMYCTVLYCTADLYRDVVPGRGERHVVAEAGGPLQQLPPLAAPRHHLNLVLLVDHHPAPHSLYQTCQPCLTKLTWKLQLRLSLPVVNSTIPREKLLLTTDSLFFNGSNKNQENINIRFSPLAKKECF